MADRTHATEEELTRTGTAERGGKQEDTGTPVTPSPDEFVSSEVNDRTARPGHPDKTRG